MRETTETRHHILLVDDEPAVAQLLSQLLDNLGYRVTVCTESNGALQCFGSDPAAFDLLITDFLMPGRNGLQLSRALLETRPDLPILVCTGNPNDLPARETWPAAVHGLLGKPFSSRQLAEMVEQALQPGAPAAPTN